MTLTGINEHNIGSPTPLSWNETPQDFLAGSKPWDASGGHHTEGQQQDGTPWGVDAIQIGTQVTQSTYAVLVSSPESNSILH